MGVENVGEKYRCNICGNEVIVTAVGGGTLVCCGEDMELIGEETEEEEIEGKSEVEDEEAFEEI